MQFDIFNWETQQTGIAIQFLLQLKMDSAFDKLETVVKQAPDNPYPKRVMLLVEFWRECKQKCFPLKRPEEREEWYRSIVSFSFRDVVYEQDLRLALILALAEACDRSGDFALDSGVNIAQLYQICGKLPQAETALRKRIADCEYDGQLLLQLANLLYQQGQLDEAASHYQMVLLHQPSLMHSDLADLRLQKVLDKHSMKHGLPIAALLQIIPQGKIALETIDFESPHHEHALHCYQKICEAERMRRSSSNIQELLPSRKALHEYDSDIFQIYMRHIEGTHKLSAIL